MKSNPWTTPATFRVEKTYLFEFQDRIGKASAAYKAVVADGFSALAKNRFVSTAVEPSRKRAFRRARNAHGNTNAAPDAQAGQQKSEFSQGSASFHRQCDRDKTRPRESHAAAETRSSCRLYFKVPRRCNRDRAIHPRGTGQSDRDKVPCRDYLSTVVRPRQQSCRQAR